MSSVISLSDSDEPVSPVNKCMSINNGDEYAIEINKKCDPDVENELNLPKMPFSCDIAQNLISRSEQNLSDLSDNNDLKYARYESSHATSDSRDSEDNRIDKAPQTQKTAKPRKKSKATLKEERLKRQRALEREKTLKAVASKNSKNLKPGECIKFMEVILDQGIDEFAFRTKIESVLLDANIKFNITIGLIPNSIMWHRNIEENYIDEKNEICVKKTTQTEKYAIVIWSNYEAVKHIAEGTFCAFVSSIKALVPNYNITLVIVGMEEYFTYQKKVKERSGQNSGNKEPKSSNRSNQQFKTFPIISRQQLEICLTEVHIITKCNSRLIENIQDLALMIYQYTKSISEIPYKIQNTENLESKFDWYVMGDNKNTIRVDKNGNGLKRLWQQQLCQFNLCSLETAEAICTIYPSPVQLIQAYKNCTLDEGMNLLKDIPIRRAAGPLTTVRKVGPELSKKMYMMFTSLNGDVLLGTDE